MSTRRLLAVVGLLASIAFTAGCSASADDVASEARGSTESNLDRTVYRGTYLELVDLNSPETAPEDHQFEVRAFDKDGSPTQLQAGEAVVLKASADALGAYARMRNRPFHSATNVTRCRISMTYTGSGLSEANDSREVTPGSDGWESQPFTVPAGYQTASISLRADLFFPVTTSLSLTEPAIEDPAREPPVTEPAAEEEE